MNAASVFAELSEHVPQDAVICVDVGNNTYSFGRYFEVDNQDVLMSGYLGSIGFAFPAAMGTWAAVGDTRKVVSVSGDGGFGQYAMEPLSQQVIVANGITSGTFMVVPNRTGDEGALRLYGSSFISDPYGRVLAQAPRDEEVVLVADLDLEQRRD